MSSASTGTGLQLRSTAKKDGTLELSLVSVPTPTPKPEEVIVRIDASPINPSDQGLLFGGADMSTAQASGTPDRPLVTASIPPAALKGIAGRLDQSDARGQRRAPASSCRPVTLRPPRRSWARPSPSSAAPCTRSIAASRRSSAWCCRRAPRPPRARPASSIPLTALGMVGTMRAKGHKALVHTAAASNLGQMLVKICLKDGVPPRQHRAQAGAGRRAEAHRRDPRVLLRAPPPSWTTSPRPSPPPAPPSRSTPSAAEPWPGRSSRPWKRRRTGRRRSTAATARRRTSRSTSTAGSTGDRPSSTRTFGMAWGIGGWLLTAFIQKIGFEAAQKLRERVAAEVKTTFASTYTKEVSLAGALQLDEIAGIREAGHGREVPDHPEQRRPLRRGRARTAPHPALSP